MNQVPIADATGRQRISTLRKVICLARGRNAWWNRRHHKHGQLVTFTLLWIPATLAAALAQTARNAMQRSLTDAIGVVGATQVRFLYGLPFALVFLALVALVHGHAPPVPDRTALVFAVAGALAQIMATAMMLKAMRTRSFAVTIAYTKTEPVQVALVAWAVLGDVLTPLKLGFIALATCGVVLVSWKPGEKLSAAGVAPALLGIGSGTMFAVAAVAFRGGILTLPPDESFLMRATTILALGLAIQTVLLLAYLTLFNRAALSGSLKAWRPSLTAGFLGALASQFWFIGFALTTAANVRTLALIEVVLAQVVSRRLFAEGQSWRDLMGMALIVLGVAGILVLAI
jgi:drug/metabolite transporter (DMT)-like permease